MTITHRFLCLFSSREVERASLFGERAGHWVTDIDAGACEFVPLRLDGEAGHWVTDIDAGACEFVPLRLDGEAGALAASGLFAGATLLCRAADLDASTALAARAAAEGFRAAGLGFELVAAEGPVALLARLSALEPGLVGLCHQDGEVRPESPSWWRERARRHLAAVSGAGATGDVEEADAEAELRAFVARRRGARAPA